MKSPYNNNTRRQSTPVARNNKKREFGGGMTQSMKAKAHVAFSITENASKNENYPSSPATTVSRASSPVGSSLLMRKGSSVVLLGENNANNINNPSSTGTNNNKNTSFLMKLAQEEQQQIAASRRHSRYFRIWKRILAVVLFCVRSKIVMIREKVTRLTKFELDQIKTGFRNFIPQFGAITAGKTGEFFRFVGVALSDEDGETAALNALSKAGKGDNERMKKTELTLTQILKIAQILKKKNVDTSVSEEELAFEAIREWMIAKSRQQLENNNNVDSARKNTATPRGDEMTMQQIPRRSPRTAAGRKKSLSLTDPNYYVQLQKEKELQQLKVTESDVHECLSSFGVVPSGFTEAAIREQEHLQKLARKNRRSHSFFFNASSTTIAGQANSTSGILMDQSTTTPLKSARGGDETRGTNSASGTINPDDSTSTPPMMSARNNNSNSGVASLETTGVSSTTFFGGGIQRTSSMFPQQHSKLHQQQQQPPPSNSPIQISTFREVFFQQKGPINKYEDEETTKRRESIGEDSSFIAFLTSNNSKTNNYQSGNRKRGDVTFSNADSPGGGVGGGGVGDSPGSNHHHHSMMKQNNNTKSGNNNSNSKDPHNNNNNNNNNNTKDSSNLIESILFHGTDNDHGTLRRRGSFDDDDYEETDQERIGKILRTIKVNMDLPPSLALDAPPIEPSYEMRDWKERKELKKMTATKNRFDAESEVGRGTGVRVLPTKIGARIIREASSFKAQVAKASDDALMRAVQKNVKETIVDKAAIESKERFKAYRRTKEEEDAAKEYLQAKKNQQQQYAHGGGFSRKQFAGTPQPSSGKSHHIQVVRNLGNEHETPSPGGGRGDDHNDADSDDDNLPGWMKRARKRKTFVPFMQRPIPRSDYSRHLREALPSKAPQELCPTSTFQLTTEQRMQLGAKLAQDQQQLQQELLMEQHMQAQQSAHSYQHSDARMAASVLLDALEIRQRDEEHQQQQAQQQLLSAPDQPNWAGNNNNHYSNMRNQPRASSVPMM